MFTQCSKCETVFRLSAEALRTAGGQVRCGRCGEVFNALTRLAEDAGEFIKGESSLELETRADEILESTGENAQLEAQYAMAADDPDLPPDMEIARLHIADPVDAELAAENSLEFTLPPGELDRIFIETRPGPLQQLEAPPPHPESLSLYADQATIASLPLVPSTAPATSGKGTAPTGNAGSATPGTGLSVSGPKSAAPAAVSRIRGLEVSDNVRAAMMSSYTPAQLPQIDASRRRLPFAAWLAAAIVLTLLLLAQIVRNNIDWVALHAPLLNGSEKPVANLASYQLRQWGVTGDPAAKGTLRVRASIMNIASELQPYPLLRVTFANRFGVHIGTREFEPAEYLGKPTARQLAPGERVDATLDILDPGQEAEGFEIDVCVRTGEQKVACASDATARAK